MGSNSTIYISHLASAEMLADKFSNYLMTKTTIIRNKIVCDHPNTACNISTDADIIFIGNMFELFRPTSEVQVKEIIIKSPQKSCELDPMRTWLLQIMSGPPSATDNSHYQ